MSNIYTQRVQILNADGSPYQVYGAYGTEPGQFQNVIDAAADSAGNVYILDTVGVTVYDSAGTYSHRWTVAGAKLGISFAGGLVAVLLAGQLNCYTPDGGLDHAAPLTPSQLSVLTNRVDWRAIRAGSGNSLWLTTSASAGLRWYSDVWGSAFRKIDLAGATLSETTYTDATLGGWGLGITIYGLAVDGGGVPWIITTAGSPTRIALLNNANGYVKAPTGGDVVNNLLCLGYGLVSQSGAFVYTRLRTDAFTSVGSYATGDLLRVMTPALATVDSFGPVGYQNGEFAANAGVGRLCRPCCLVGGRLVVLDGTYLPLPNRTATTDHPFGFRHYLGTSGTNIVHHRALMGGALSPTVTLGPGEGMSVEALPNGSLRATVVNGDTKTTYLGHDLGEVWEQEP